MNPLATELNHIIRAENLYIYEMLSEVGKNLFFPKGILSQSAEAKQKAHRFNATIGMATENGRTMFMPSVMQMINGLEPEESLTYAPSFGIPALREAWRKEIYEKNPSLAGKPISLPVVTNALTHGLSVVSDMWVDPGNVIILPDKMWGNYNIIFSVRRGARVVQYNLFNNNKGFNTDSFTKCIEDQAKEQKKLIVILNFPNNPTGYTITTEEGNAIVDALVKVADNGTNIIAVTDDAYFGLFYKEDILKESIFSLICGSHPRIMAIKVDGATKENFVWGLRIGFITYGASINSNGEKLYEALEKKTAGAVRGSISNASHLGQIIVLKSMQSENYKKEKQEKYKILHERARELKNILSDSKYQSAWDVYPFNSGYFMCIRVKEVEAEALRIHLLEKYGVGLIALGKHDLRIAFSCIEKKDLRELFDTILQGINDIKNK